jgi:hypothetical protein
MVEITAEEARKISSKEAMLKKAYNDILSCAKKNDRVLVLKGPIWSLGYGSEYDFLVSELKSKGFDVSFNDDEFFTSKTVIRW